MESINIIYINKNNTSLYLPPGALAKICPSFKICEQLCIVPGITLKASMRSDHPYKLKCLNKLNKFLELCEYVPGILNKKRSPTHLISLPLYKIYLDIK